MNNLFNLLPPKFRILVKPVFAILVLSIVFLFVGKFAFFKIKSVKNQIKNAQKNKNILNQKIALLREVQADVSNKANLSFIALPDSNPALIVTSQVKLLAKRSGLTLVNFKSGAKIKNKKNYRADLTFNVEGNEHDMMDFLKSIEFVIPITKVSKVKLNQASGVIRAKVTTSFFWSDLPKDIPAITQKIKGFTPEEEKTLIQIGQMQFPSFLFTKTASKSGGRRDPFN